MDESRTRALLAEISSDPEPPSRVDLDQVIAAGHRSRYRGAWVAAAAAVVLVVAVGVFIRPGPEKPDPVVSVPPAPSPVTAPTAFDPLRARVVPGWLPDGSNGSQHVVSAVAESYTQWYPNGGEVAIYLARRRGAPQQLGGGNGRPEKGPAVNGVPSTWEPAEDDSGIFRWEWAPGAPAVIRISRIADSRAVAARIASGLRLGSERPVALPFTTVRPTGLSPVASQILLQPGVASPEGSLDFNGDGGDAHAVTVRLFTDSPDSPSSINANTTLNRRPASVEATALNVIVEQRSGRSIVEVQCQVRKGHSVDAVRTECLRVAGSVQLVGSVNKPSTWSTSPVR